ncbi:vanadium-dependent haloperoxidase [Danxiaibacter flavus]|uniref:Vanadium-dependent haloperoxidase n=1 Tax=Danxiaibacter flavus TaxID=3049108 RepID=A0ABV3ZIH9_9BACT|nr:vanadium-dependent haloperoxidase [Chitinophagaceae bacterium DXS]
MKIKYIFLVPFLMFAGNAPAQINKMGLEQQIKPAVFSLSMVMMHDVVNPPAASRYFAYCMMGAYTIVAQNDTSLRPLESVVRSWPKDFKLNQNRISYDPQIAAVYCILETGRQMLPSGYMLKEKEDSLVAFLKKKKVAKAIIEQSVSVAQDVAGQVVKYSATDHYNKLSALLRYTPLKGDGFWYPTPPAYIEAVEPNWKTVRPMIIDSCDQFKPMAPVVFSKDTASGFYLLNKEVYDAAVNAKPEQQEIAAFWDCNPFAISTSGHMSLGFKKISPGAHWMNIISIAAEKAGVGFNRHITLLTVGALTAMDAFISCWDEKYRSNRIRPETYINRYIDANWQPLLQTPPFPEYPSGHSVVSAACAEVLTYCLGDNFSFTDNTEIMFELKPRTFASFRQAAAEAAISRLYGGIHYRDAIENGVAEGKALAGYIISKLQSAGVR